MGDLTGVRAGFVTLFIAFVLESFQPTTVVPQASPQSFHLASLGMTERSMWSIALRNLEGSLTNHSTRRRRRFGLRQIHQIRRNLIHPRPYLQNHQSHQEILPHGRIFPAEFGTSASF